MNYVYKQQKLLQSAMCWFLDNDFGSKFADSISNS